MDPMTLFDMERRTGISNNEVDDFVERMDLLSDAMEQIKNGTFDPNHCKIPGYKTPEQEEREAQERKRKDEEHRRKEKERKRKATEDEREVWWRRAKLRFAVERGEGGEGEDESEGQEAKATHWVNRVLAAYKSRDANDYSVWNNWVPEDPVSVEEKAAREAVIEKLRNEEFEKNNPEFCEQFKEDLAKRQKSQKEQERDAERFKMIGNRHYKRKEYTQAIDKYMQALEKAPYNVAVLTNISQCYLRLEALDDSIEFSSRALYVNPDHVKALSRRAAAWYNQKRLKEAAQDMVKALQLEPTNPDVVEQHSIVVGDYKDAQTQSQLAQTMDKKSSHQHGEELRFVDELLKKMNEREEELETAEDGGNTVSEAWMAYDLLVPVLERNVAVKDLLRTTGELHRLVERVLRVLGMLPQLVERWNNRSSAADDGYALPPMVEKLTVGAMFHAVAASLAGSPRNQVVLHREATFRDAIVGLLKAGTLASLPMALQYRVLQIVDEAIESKSWRRDMATSPVALSCVISAVAYDEPATPTDDETLAALTASGILLTVSSDEALGLRTQSADAKCLEAIAAGLSRHRRSAATLSNLLGVLINVSTSLPWRATLEASDSESLRSRLVRSLVVLAGHFTNSSLAEDKRAVFRVCAARSLAALLNFTHSGDSSVRTELAKHTVPGVVQSILAYCVAQGADPGLLLVVSRAVSLLCRLHSTQDESILKQLTSPLLLDQLYQLCEVTLPYFSASQATLPSQELWQTQAQLWCHMGWGVSLPGPMGEGVRKYLVDKQAVPAMLETLRMVNAQRMYRRGSSEPPTGPERIVGNVVKVLIALTTVMAGSESFSFWRGKRNLKVLVDALQDLPDGLARKNVAILLAKLCQVGGDAVKDRVRELRGIEMMLSVSKSLTTDTKAKAVAF